MFPMKNTIKALIRAKEICKSQHGLARAINNRLIHQSVKPVKQQNVWSWINETGSVPPEYCIPIEEATGGVVKAIHLRPDVFKLGYAVEK